MGHSGIFFGPILFADAAREVFIEPTTESSVRFATMEIDTSPQASNFLRMKPGMIRRKTAGYGSLLYPVQSSLLSNPILTSYSQTMS